MAFAFQGSALCVSYHQHIWICHMHQRGRLRIPSYLWSSCQNYSVQHWRLIILSLVNFIPCHLITVFNRLLFTPTYSIVISRLKYMMTSYNGNIFRVTGPLCGEFTGLGEFPSQRPVTRRFDVFFDLRLNKRLSKLIKSPAARLVIWDPIVVIMTSM